MKSAYDVLGIAPNASEEEIKRAFRSYSKVLHPDVCKRKTAAVEFKELKTAYDTLIDRNERQRHDYALAVVETKDVKKDAIDDVLDQYGIDLPKKKKKKKKKKEKSQQEQAREFQQQYAAPPSQQYQYQQPQQYGQGYFEGIPDGFDNNCDLGGVL